jgi:hypothetical protein
MPSVHNCVFFDPTTLSYPKKGATMKANRLISCFVFIVFTCILIPLNCSGDAWGRIAFYAQTAGTSSEDGTETDFNELVTTFALQSVEAEQGLEYAADLRLAGYPGDPNDTRRVSIYSAYVGHKFNDGSFSVRGGSRR